ncbi:MAG: YjjG family noncanonical pyrimidine nucleotidase [Firmicutes bacterium]|nr:YjjG family noncanonical pyrimidine nucleotidase [Bacillota bacterium]
MIKVILWDIDATLLDFLAAEKAAIRFCFEIHGLGTCTDEMLARYTVINKRYWEMLERGEMSKPEILVNRFKEFFATEGIETDCAKEFNETYQVALGDTICFRDHGYELVEKLQGSYRQFAVTNGTFVAQERKLRKSGLGEMMEEAFISDLIGFEKPSIEFFDFVFEKIGRYEKDEVIIVGDSLTSDMQGGNNAGILCCWYNPEHLENTKNVRIDYEIDDLWQLEEILKKHE